MALDKIKAKRQKRIRRHKRVRARVSGTAQKPRLFVYRSNKHIYAGLADDQKGQVILSVSDKDLGDKKSSNANIEVATKVGEEIAKAAKKAGYKKVVFDRGGYRYHGKIKALADGARSAGLNF